MKAKEVVDELTVKRAITRITYEIIERNKDLNKIVLAGIKNSRCLYRPPNPRTFGATRKSFSSCCGIGYQTFP